MIFTARRYAECGYATVCRLSVRLSVCPSVCLSVTLFRYRDHIGWNLEYLENNLQLINLRFVLVLTPTWAIWCNGNTSKIRVE